MVIEAHHESRALDDLASVLEPLQHGAINRNEQIGVFGIADGGNELFSTGEKTVDPRDGSIIRHEEGDLLVRETLTQGKAQAER